MNIDYDTVYNKDIRFYTNITNGFVKRREVYMNDIQIVGDRIATKIAQRVWGAEDGKKPLDTIRFNEDSVESQNEKVLKTLKAKGVV